MVNSVVIGGVISFVLCVVTIIVLVIMMNKKVEVVSDIKNEMSTVTDLANQANNSINNLQKRFDELEIPEIPDNSGLINSIGNNDKRITTLEETVKTIEGDTTINTVQSSLKTVTDTTNDNKTKITSLENNLKNVTTATNDNKSKISSLEGDINRIDTMANDNRNRISTIDSNYNTMMTQANDYIAKISTLEGSLKEITSTTDELKKSNEELASQVTNMSNKKSQMWNGIWFMIANGDKKKIAKVEIKSDKPTLSTYSNDITGNTYTLDEPYMFMFDGTYIWCNRGAYVGGKYYYLKADSLSDGGAVSVQTGTPASTDNNSKWKIENDKLMTYYGGYYLNVDSVLKLSTLPTNDVIVKVNSEFTDYNNLSFLIKYGDSYLGCNKDNRVIYEKDINKAIRFKLVDGLLVDSARPTYHMNLDYYVYMTNDTKNIPDRCILALEGSMIKRRSSGSYYMLNHAYSDYPYGSNLVITVPSTNSIFNNGRIGNEKDVTGWVVSDIATGYKPPRKITSKTYNIEKYKARYRGGWLKL